MFKRAKEGRLGRGRQTRRVGERVFFATDLHGSERCWRKFVNAAAFYEASVLVMGGDLTGKMVVPLVRAENDRYEGHIFGEDRTIDACDIAKVESALANAGLYGYRTTKEELAVIDAADDSSQIDRIFLALMIERLSRWLEFAYERLGPAGVPCFISPGNDDYPELDEILAKFGAHSEGCVTNANGRVVQVAKDHEMITVGTSNHTPWNTPREATEDELTTIIDELVGQLRAPETAVFNLHVPPYGSKLDQAPELDENLRPVTQGGTVIMGPVGSTAVRGAIERHQPLVALHGHVHEGKGFIHLGRTLCINPGSEYGDGILDGVLVDLDADAVQFTLVSG
jgi:Icc-related predicted phosphoesterase